MNYAATSTISALALLAQVGGVKPNDVAGIAIAEQLKAVLAETLITQVPGPRELQGLPASILLQRVIPVAIAAELLGVTPETVLKKHRDKLIQIDGRRFGMRLYHALRLEPPRKPRSRAQASSKRRRGHGDAEMAEAP